MHSDSIKKVRLSSSESELVKNLKTLIGMKILYKERTSFNEVKLRKARLKDISVDGRYMYIQNIYHFFGKWIETGLLETVTDTNTDNIFNKFIKYLKEEND